MWKLYLALSPEQHRAARSAKGLPSSSMTDAQKYLAHEAAHGAKEEAGFESEWLKARYVFSVYEGRANWSDIDKEADRISSTTARIGFPYQANKFIVFRFTGDCPKISAFNWPSPDER